MINKGVYMEIISIILVGISLSMDTFSLSLGYGTMDLPSNKVKALTLIVGFYHFFMPLLGMLAGHLIGHFILIDVRYVVFIIFMILGLEMISNVIEKKKSKFLLTTMGLLIFGFTVSIDSFSAGIGFEFISNKHLLCSFIFSITSGIFTYAGLKLGGKLSERFNAGAQIVGSIILIFFAMFYLFG